MDIRNTFPFTTLVMKRSSGSQASPSLARLQVPGENTAPWDRQLSNDGHIKEAINKSLRGKEKDDEIMQFMREHAISLCFLDRCGLVAFLSLSTNCLFPRFNNVASTIIRHILEDPHTLQEAMESEIRHNLVAALNLNISRRAEAYAKEAISLD